MNKRPRLSFWQILNMSFGFLGIQMGFALQNANASAILRTFGADVHHLPLFWLVAPITGMLVQPIIGYFSDKTWCGLGRRRPYFLVGAILTSTALILMPNAPSFAGAISPMLIGGGMLMIMDASINISMEPFRALVADKLPDEQRTLGFSTQTLLIGVGAVIGSWLPYILGNYMGFSKVAEEGIIADNVKYSFYFGAFVLISSIIWTVATTKEYPPDFYEEDEKDNLSEALEDQPVKKKGFKIPKTMWQLLLVQFFSWFALFSMWVFTAPAIAEHFYGVTDANAPEFNEAQSWVGILFGVYNGVSAVLALTLPIFAKYIGRKQTHALALSIGGVSLISMIFFSSATWLLLPMVGIGIAWASILSMPYAILSSSIDPKQMGMMMGLFNMSITIPQIVNGLTGGFILENLLGNNLMMTLVLAGVMMLLGAVAVVFVKDKHTQKA